MKIGIVVGSLREESWSKKVAKSLAELAPQDLEFETVNISNLPIYNQDFDDKDALPEAYQPFRDTIKNLEGFLFVTPEYNRSLPAALKNALDVASRPFGHNEWSGKPAMIASVSPGKLSAFGANHHFRQVCVFLNLYVMAQPEAYIGNVADLYDEAGNLTPSTVSYFTKIITAFADWTQNFKK